jgi:hypothetical protein
LVNRLEPNAPSRVRPVRGLEEYDREFYESHYNKSSVEHFMGYAEETAAMVARHGWPLELKFNKHYCGFKHGFFNAFGIMWIGSKSFGYFFKVPLDEAERLAPKGVEMTRYQEGWKQAVFKIYPGRTKVDAFEALFRSALESVTGKQLGT